ncbi:GNAT family N-acetyltransferase [Streptomyces sp. NBC_00445]|uniref:GNAT family N-acetyltransferase n=1 Tax=Streptomyces sp. NBC_00445 TaxID=2975745 RepID=UPI002E24A258
MTAMTSWTVAPEPVDSPTAAALWRAYYTEVSDRWYLLHEGHRTDPAELEREIAADTGAELVPPTGQLLVARYEGKLAGTAGIRLLVRAAENAAVALGAERMILDTRHDLVEARTLYTRLGYEETEPYNDDTYAEHWFSKKLKGDCTP